MWNKIKRIQGKQRHYNIDTIKTENRTTSDNQEIAELLVDHYKKIQQTQTSLKSFWNTKK